MSRGASASEPSREGRTLTLPDLPEECLSAVLTILPLATVAQCASACKALGEVVALDSTWRALSLAMPACMAIPVAARLEMEASRFAGWRQVAQRLKNAPAVPTSLHLPDKDAEAAIGEVRMCEAMHRQPVVYYTGGIGSDRAVRTNEPWTIFYRRRPKRPPADGLRVMRRHFRYDALYTCASSCHSIFL